MNEEFKKEKFRIIKQAIHKDVTLFLENYLRLKKEVFNIMQNHKYLSPYDTNWGRMGDEQVPGCYAHYADVAMENLLLFLRKKVQKATGLELSPNYTYTRLYTKGAELKRHKDRFSCEISTTLNLGGDPWPIFVDNTNSNIVDETKEYVSPMNKGIQINLNPGDMLVYQGQRIEHWREPFEGNYCAQVFLHYNDLSSGKAKENLYDRRPLVGLPAWFQGRNASGK